MEIATEAEIAQAENEINTMSSVRHFSDDELEDLHEKTGIPMDVLKTIDKGIEELKKGNVSDPIDIDDLPEPSDDKEE